MSEPNEAGEVVFGDLTIGKLLPADTVLPSPCAHQWLLLPPKFDPVNISWSSERAWCPECGETREAP